MQSEEDLVRGAAEIVHRIIDLPHLHVGLFEQALVQRTVAARYLFGLGERLEHPMSASKGSRQQFACLIETRCQFDRPPHALFLIAQGKIVAGLVLLAKTIDEIEIEGIANPVLGLPQGMFGRRRQHVMAAGADADDRQMALSPAAMAGEIPIVGRLGDSEGSALALDLGHDEAAFGPREGKGRRFRHAGNAYFLRHQDRWRDEPRFLGPEALG